jgi:phosphoglycerol transferase MdoB-like AlkP superfamily enzyme
MARCVTLRPRVRNDVLQPREEKLAKISRWREWVAVLGAYVVLPNLPFLIASRFIYLERAAINLDYVVLGLLSPLLPKALNLVLFAVVFLLDILFSSSGVYHFPVADAVRALRNLGHVSVAVTVPVLLLAILAAYGLVRLATQWRRMGGSRQWGKLVFVLVALVVLDFASTRHLARSSAGTTAIAIARDFQPLDLKPENLWRTESATLQLNKDIDTGKLAAENVVLVMVESLGEARDPALANWIEQPLLSGDISKRYSVSRGTVEFEGSTVFGELRELCGLRGVGMRMAELQTSQTGGCLPAKLNARGYETVSIHGVTSAMFRRSEWYPRLGFQRMIFPENWPRKDPNFCNAQFHGICDLDGAGAVRDELLAATRPEFVYWLTIESHVQLDSAERKPSAGDCKNIEAEVCQMVTTQRNVLTEIAKIVLDPALKPTRFVVVGDHSPPYMLRRRRDLFAQKLVPWMELQPKPQI